MIRYPAAAFATALFACTALFARVAEQAQDTVIRAGAVPLTNVKVVTDTWREVVAQRGPVKNPEPSCNVLDVRYANEPDTYRKGREAGEKGDYVWALKNLLYCFKNDLNERTANLKQYLYYYIAYYYLKHGGEGAFQKARDHLDLLLQEVPESRFVPDALVLYADTYFHEGEKLEEAMKAYEDARSKLISMSRKVLGDHQKYMEEKAYNARYRKAECMMLLGNHAEAKQEFQGVKSRTRSFPRVNLLATLGMARALWQEGKYDDSFKEFELLVLEAEKSGIRDILAGAYAGLADCHFEKKEYRRALWEYLRVIVQYFDAKEYIPKATYRAGLCYLSIAENEPNNQGAEKMARLYLQKAAKMEAPFWSEKARQALENL